MRPVNPNLELHKGFCLKAGFFSWKRIDEDSVVTVQIRVINWAKQTLCNRQKSEKKHSHSM